MAARRLIIVLLVLFGISVAAAAIAPDRKGGLIGASSSDSTSASSTTSDSSAPSAAAGVTLTARIDAGSARPEAVNGFVGDQLELAVTSREKGRVIEIDEYGVTEFAGPNAPAEFNLLLRDPGRFPITDGGGGRIVGRLVVRERERK
jgi:hypothetical protein